MSNAIKMLPVPDRLRALLDLVTDSLDEPEASGRELALRAHFSRDHLDRLIRAATGETPVALRRRLLLERAAWQLIEGAAPAASGRAAGYGSTAAFSRAFSRAFGVPPRVFATSGGSTRLDAPNGVHFHPPGGIVLPSAPTAAPPDLVTRVQRHLSDGRGLLVRVEAVPRRRLEERRRPGHTVTSFEGEEATAASMAERLVLTLEIWVAAIEGETFEGPPMGSLLERHDRISRRFAAFATSVRDRSAWSEGFIDALCEPPESFTYGGVLEHVLDRGAVRCRTLGAVLDELE